MIMVARMKLKKELQVVKVEFDFTNYGNFYLEDSDGKCYYWYTSSDKAYEKMKEGTKHLCTFILTGRTWKRPDNGKLLNVIKNVRF